jgi:hypothetical protein
MLQNETRFAQLCAKTLDRAAPALNLVLSTRYVEDDSLFCIFTAAEKRQHMRPLVVVSVAADTPCDFFEERIKSLNIDHVSE